MQTVLECLATFIIIFGSSVLALIASEYLLGGRQNDNAVDPRRCLLVARPRVVLRGNLSGTVGEANLTAAAARRRIDID